MITYKKTIGIILLAAALVITYYFFTKFFSSMVVDKDSKENNKLLNNYHAEIVYILPEQMPRKYSIIDISDIKALHHALSSFHNNGTKTEDIPPDPISINININLDGIMHNYTFMQQSRILNAKIISKNENQSLVNLLNTLTRARPEQKLDRNEN